MPDINSYFSPLFCLRNYPWKSLMFYFKTDLDLFILNSNFTNPWRVGSLCFYDFGFFFFSPKQMLPWRKVVSNIPVSSDVQESPEKSKLLEGSFIFLATHFSLFFSQFGQFFDSLEVWGRRKRDLRMCEIFFWRNLVINFFRRQYILDK